MRNRINRGFTLIEILIVVVILGILAAIVIPQFTSAADEAKESSLRSQLQTVRGQIELYNVQQGAYPDFNGNGWDNLVDNGYLQAEPRNAWRDNGTGILQGTAAVGAAAGAAADGDGNGWYWNTGTEIMMGISQGNTVYDW